MAEPVLLISSDPFLGASLEAVGRGRLHVARLDPAHRPPAWPAAPSTSVVLDVTARQRDSIHTWVRRHHAGPLVVLLKPGERHPSLPPDRARVVVSRPFRLIDLIALLEQFRSPEPPGGDPEQGREGAQGWDEEEGAEEWEAELEGNAGPNPARRSASRDPARRSASPNQPG